MQTRRVVWTKCTKWKCSFPNSRSPERYPLLPGQGRTRVFGNGLWMMDQHSGSGKKKERPGNRYVPSKTQPSCVERTRSGSHAHLHLRLRLNRNKLGTLTRRNEANRCTMSENLEEDVRLASWQHSGGSTNLLLGFIMYFHRPSYSLLVQQSSNPPLRHASHATPKRHGLALECSPKDYGHLKRRRLFPPSLDRRPWL